ncbi:MAG: tetratricopeptide repeat protein, partial [Planctomycetota bacterium]
MWIARGILLALALGSTACQTRPPKPKTGILRSLDALEKNGLKAYEEGRYASALKIFREVETLARSTDNLHALANTFNNLGAVQKAMGEETEAAKAFEEALILNRTLGLDRAQAENLVNLTALELDKKKGDLARAREYNRLAEALFEKVDSPLGLLHVQNNEGRILFRQGKAEQAKDAFDDAISDARDVESRRIRAVLLANRGNAHETLGDLKAALEDFREALALDRETEVFTGV